MYTRVARFYSVQHTETVEIYQMTTKYTKWPKNIQSGCKIFLMTTKYTNIFCSMDLQNISKIWSFCFENIPSGSPDVHRELCTALLPALLDSTKMPLHTLFWLHILVPESLKPSSRTQPALLDNTKRIHMVTWAEVILPLQFTLKIHT
jgi:hypothetical protein